MYLYNRMIVFRLTWIIALLIILTGCSSVVLSTPKKTPVAASYKQQELLLLGEQYFKQGRVKTALKTVRRVYELNPDNVEAQYAIARCYLSLRQYSKSLEFSRLAASYRSDNLPDIYLLMGKTYQQMDEPWDALRTFRYAASQYPGDSKLQYALGETYVYLDKLEFAGDAFKAALAADPGDAASHYQLGILYHTNDYSIPALLAFCMSLLLEPHHARSHVIHQDVISLLGSDLESRKKDEGNFQSVESALNRQRDSLLKGVDKHNVFAIIQVQFLALYVELDTDEIRRQEKAFVIDTYVPFFNNLNKQGLAKTSVYYMFQDSQDEVINIWLKQNPEKVKMLELFVKTLSVAEKN